ncbi:cytoskeletal protein binding protein [Fusarium oxysporum]|nr:cytoskeletal protein binding protein [Fusarium oxysporum]
MGFLGVHRALYDYVPQAEGELAIKDGDLLFILDKNGDDGWWKAKKKAGADDEEEPTGLIPGNYVEEAQPVDHARALFDYTRQTDEELSFHEDATLAVYDTSDPDWILTGLDGEYGFVPSNYIEMGAPAESAQAAAAVSAASATFKTTTGSLDLLPRTRGGISGPTE